MTSLVITQILNGLTIGLVYALVALGLTIVLGLMEILNFSHGSFYMLGGYITFLTVYFTGNFWIGLMVAALACGVLSIGLFYTIVIPFKNRPPLQGMVAFIGVAMIIRQLTRTIWGADPKLLAIPFGTVEIEVFGLSIVYPIYFLVVMIIATAMLVSLHFMLRKVDLGIRCLAAIQDRDVALCMGVNVDRISFMMFAIGTAVAGVAGGLVGPIFSVYPTMGIELMGLLFVIAIVGGLGSIGGAVIAGVTIAMTKSVSSIFFPGNVSEIFAYCVLLGIILMRPRGIMGLASVMEKR